jgi:hypothetical protein
MWVPERRGGAWLTAVPPAQVAKRLKGFQSHNKLKKAIGGLLAKRMSEGDVETLAEAFKRFDVNGDGKLSAVRLRCCAW